MSTILVIKHGALGDLIQSLGVMQDISEHHDKPIDVISNRAYKSMLEALPFVNQVIVDQRPAIHQLKDWMRLAHTLKQKSYTHVYDLQNSKRSTWYRWLFFARIPFISTRTILKKDETKVEFDKQSVLERFFHQLTRSGIQPKHWQHAPVSALIDPEYQAHVNLKPYFFLAPFCSPQHPQKRWPHFAELLEKLKTSYPHHRFVIAPGPGEVDEAKNYACEVLLDDGKPTNFSQLISIIAGADCVIANDTGAAHIAKHLHRPGLVLMGPQLKPQTLGLESSNMNIIQHPQALSAITVEDVVDHLQKHLTSSN
jgi:ADP-heptose:LPS heptosyltransferase